jgi:hypothetical protein
MTVTRCPIVAPKIGVEIKFFMIDHRMGQTCDQLITTIPLRWPIPRESNVRLQPVIQDAD